MTVMTDFYRERADDSRKGAAAATLQQVRERWLVAEATWTQLAVRAERAQALHNDLIARKAAERCTSCASPS